MNDLFVPPGETTAIRIERALVLAPHFDDETIGCGGLVATLASAGAEVSVLFVSNGAGGEEAVGDREAYAARRRDEATAALEVLGARAAGLLELPDGALDHHLEAIAAAIGEAISEQRPELVLAPSPLELSADHRAVFAALHECLTGVRDDDSLAAATAGLEVLLYEVNGPGRPDLLVDVGAALETLEAAFACYPSQLELHDYRAAALGLRRFRTLTLAPGVEAAEGYRRLELADFTTHSLSDLVRRLGGSPALRPVEDGPRVSVVVRTKDRPGLLAEALASIAESTYRRVEVVLVNDGGRPPEPPAGFPFELVRIDLESNQGRAAAANAGIAAASGDYVCFLDDDDLMAPEHLATLAGAVSAADVRVAYTDAAVGVYELDGERGWREVERRLPYSRDFDPELLLVDNYIPFNTVIVERGLLAEAGQLDPALPFFEDWELLIRLAAIAPFHHLRRVTCEYRHFRGGSSHVFGERPAERDDFLRVKADVLGGHAARLTPATLARVVARLRAEQVAGVEAAAGARREAEALGRRVAEAEDAYHRLNGERASLAAERERLLGEIEQLAAAHRRLLDEHAQRGAEIDRLHGEERSLHAAVDEQGEHITRVHAEIERLEALIREMESTRAWHLHSWWQRLLRRG